MIYSSYAQYFFLCCVQASTICYLHLLRPGLLSKVWISAQQCVFALSAVIFSVTSLVFYCFMVLLAAQQLIFSSIPGDLHQRKQRHSAVQERKGECWRATLAWLNPVHKAKVIGKIGLTVWTGAEGNNLSAGSAQQKWRCGPDATAGTHSFELLTTTFVGGYGPFMFQGL